MKRTDGPRLEATRCMLVMAGLAIALPLHAEPIDRTAWLAGCWRGQDGERISGEQWMVPRAGAMLGMNRTATVAKVTSSEQMRIETVGESLVFTSKPSGKPEDSFMALPGDGDAIVFENEAHPFPQRIIYRRAGDAGLAARIEGRRGDGVVAIDYPMQRVPCGTS